jgi:hypothetical protein
MLRVLAAKLLGGLGLVLLVTWAATLALALSRRGEPLDILLAFIAATWLGLGAGLSAVAGAALTADFEADNPQRRIGCLGTIVTSGLSLFFFLTNTGLIAWWVAQQALRIPRPLLAIEPMVNWGLPLLALLSVMALLFASRVGLQRLASWEAS